MEPGADRPLPRVLAFLFSPRGYISRTQWWTVTLTWLVLLALAHGCDEQDQNNPFFIDVTRSPVFTAAFLLTLWPIFAVQAKRWHDRGRSAWWCFLLIIPVFGIPLTILELGFLGQSRDFTSPYYHGPRPYRERVKWLNRQSWPHSRGGPV